MTANYILCYLAVLPCMLTLFELFNEELDSKDRVGEGGILILALLWPAAFPMLAAFVAIAFTWDVLLSAFSFLLITPKSGAKQNGK